MKQKWRYNIRLSERKGVTVREGGLDDLPAIQGLMDATGKRDGFGVHDVAYHRRADRAFRAGRHDDVAARRARRPAAGRDRGLRLGHAA